MTADLGPLPVRWRSLPMCAERRRHMPWAGRLRPLRPPGPALARHLDESLEAAGWFAGLVEPAREMDRCGSDTRNSGWWYRTGATVKCRRPPLDPHLLLVRHVEAVQWRETLFHSSRRSEGSGCLKKTAYMAFLLPF